MKKALVLLFILGVSVAVPVTATDGLKDNRLQLDNSRLEREEELHFGVQSEQVKGLFNEADQKKLQEMQLNQDKQLATEGGQLFSAIEGSHKKKQESQLFQPTRQTKSKPQQIEQEASQGWSDFVPGLFYAGLSFLLIGVTGLISYQIATGQDLRKKSES